MFDVFKRKRDEITDSIKEYKMNRAEKKSLDEEVSIKDLDLANSEVEIEDLDLDNSQIEELKSEAENMEEDDIQQHEKFYSADKLWKKIQKYAKRAGSSVVYLVLLYYFTLMKPEVPVKVKATIAGALGYFILPIDIIPDVIIGAGYGDDLGVLVASLVYVSMYIDEDIKKQAKDKMKDWFGEDIDTSEIDSKLDS